MAPIRLVVSAEPDVDSASASPSPRLSPVPRPSTASSSSDVERAPVSSSPRPRVSFASIPRTLSAQDASGGSPRGPGSGSAIPRAHSLSAAAAHGQHSSDEGGSTHGRLVRSSSTPMGLAAPRPALRRTPSPQMISPRHVTFLDEGAAASGPRDRAPSPSPALRPDEPAGTPRDRTQSPSPALSRASSASKLSPRPSVTM
eukprot:tig00000269_g23715.t1